MQGFLRDGVVVGKPENYNEGDVIRIVVETSDKSISYYKNDIFIGKPFVDIDSEELITSVYTLWG